MSDMALNHSGIEGGKPTLSVVAVRDHGSVNVRGK